MLLPAGVFDTLTQLERLHLYGNQITSLPAGVFDALAKLKYVYRSFNQLTLLPTGVVRATERSTEGGLQVIQRAVCDVHHACPAGQDAQYDACIGSCAACVPVKVKPSMGK